MDSLVIGLGLDGTVTLADKVIGISNGDSVIFSRPSGRMHSINNQ